MPVLTTQRNRTEVHRGGYDTFCGGQGWTTGGRKFFPAVVHRWSPHNE